MLVMPTMAGTGPGARANKGAAGVDGPSTGRFAVKADLYLPELSTAPREGTFQPQAVKRVDIPKGDGRTRPLGIPTVKDRIVQQAVRLAIEPIFEHGFAEASAACPGQVGSPTRAGGLFANGNRADAIARARELLGVAITERKAAPAEAATVADPQVLQRPCPCCGSVMRIIETFARGCEPRHRPSPIVIRIDTS
mgnify:CR=1 FL=1